MYYRQLLHMLGIIWFVGTIQVGILLAQDGKSSPETPIFLLQNNQISQLNSTSGAQQAVATITIPLEDFNTTDVSTVDRRLYSADIDNSAHYLYMIEAFGRSTDLHIYGAPTGSELVQLDLQTNVRRVIFDQQNVFNFVLSPDEQHMVILYYESTFAYSRQQACVLDLVTLNCQQIGFRQVGNSAFWIDNTNFVLSVVDTLTLSAVDIKSLSIQPIIIPTEWQVYWATPIPNTRNLLVSATERSGNFDPTDFLVYNLDSGVIQKLPYVALNFEDFPSVGSWSFSPDGKYLLYGGDAAALIEFSTGRLIQRFEVAINTGWVNDHTLIVQGSVDGSQLEILRVDISTETTSSLLSGEAAGGILLMP